MLLKYLKFLVPLIILLFLFWNIFTQWTQVQPILANINPLSLLITFIILLLIYPQSAFTWSLLLNKFKINIPRKQAIYVWIVSNTSRYIPGTIWQYIGRVELGQHAGISRKDGIIAVITETFFMVTAGLLVSFFTITKWGNLGINIPLALIPLLGLFIVLHPSISQKILRIFLKITNKANKNVDIPTLSIKNSLSILPWFILNFFLNGLALFYLIQSTGNSMGLENIFLLSSYFALSWLIGYISIFAPGGIGVTEASLAFLLSFHMPLAMATTIALAYRFLLIVAECVVFIFVLRFKR